MRAGTVDGTEEDMEVARAERTLWRDDPIQAATQFAYLPEKSAERRRAKCASGCGSLGCQHHLERRMLGGVAEYVVRLHDVVQGEAVGGELLRRDVPPGDPV